MANYDGIIDFFNGNLRLFRETMATATVAQKRA